jgi:hypothetical protein
MRQLRKDVVWLGIIAVLVGILFMPPVSSASDLNPQLPSGVSTEGIVDAGADPAEIVEVTPWATPVLLSPNTNTPFNHYPRTTTLAWKRVTGANSYLVEAAYSTGSTWVAYPPVIVNGFNNASYTFDFIGDQKGRWRVTAYTGSDGTGSATPPSAWSMFSYVTLPLKAMATPILTNPANNEAFDHFPRTITLSWKMVAGAAGYKVEIAYCLPDRVTCWDYPPVTITDPLESYYTFDFVGAQPGKWRVTTLGPPNCRDSNPSGWRWFSFGI